MDRLLNFLKEFDAQIDFNSETELMTKGLIDSVELVGLVAELEEKFHVEIAFDEIMPENFDSAEKIWSMLQRLQK